MAWICPECDYRADVPGVCPDCGVDLVEESAEEKDTMMGGEEGWEDTEEEGDF
jgi:hypothetical protein